MCTCTGSAIHIRSRAVWFMLVASASIVLAVQYMHKVTALCVVAAASRHTLQVTVVAGTPAGEAFGPQHRRMSMMSGLWAYRR